MMRFPYSTLMVQGTTSDAGKSTLVAALCRLLARRGVRVAPFKPQNMALNSAVTSDGGEIGRAQALQAIAAGVAPHTDMNPVLLKPSSDIGAQVIIHGRVRAEMDARDYHQYKTVAMQAVLESHARLRAQYDAVIVEGAGSPAEINLRDRDIANMGFAEAVDCPVVLVADIDRGGAFAHLYGTLALMDERLRRQVRGFVLNKFRGDPALLSPGPEMLQERTGVPTLAVVPLLHGHGLPEEDGLHGDPPAHEEEGPIVAVVATPHISNLDEFEPLRQGAGVRLRWVRDEPGIAQADWLVLPGSKHTRADLRWLRDNGLHRAIEAHVGRGKPLLAVCGGLQLLGRSLADPLGLEGGAVAADEGLGLLPLHTEFQPAKRLARQTVRLSGLQGPWAALDGLEVQGYEIRAGRSAALVAPGPGGLLREVLPDGLGWQQGPVLALYLHGLFENADVPRALFGAATSGWEAAFQRLADCVDRSFSREALLRLP
jgi:adenosylcobyric acid synthase